jgi:hypothetical protein
MYEHKKCTDAGEQIEVCAMTYIKVIDNLYNGTNIVLDELIEWPAWPSPSSREYVAPLNAKMRANDPNNLRSHGMTVLQECRKLEAVLDDLQHHYGGKLPSGWEAPDKLHHVAEALWRRKEENRLSAFSIEGDSVDDPNTDMGIAVAAEIRDMPDSFLESHVYLLAWYKYGSLGAAWMNLVPSAQDLGLPLEPVTVKHEHGDDEKENGFPMNPKPTGRAAARKKEAKAHKKAAHCDGKGSSDDDSDGELRILSDLRLSLGEFVACRTKHDCLKAAKELFEVEPTDENKQNYIQALRESASPPASAQKAPQLHHTK